jgi:hypothetical protein
VGLKCKAFISHSYEIFGTGCYEQESMKRMFQKKIDTILLSRHEEKINKEIASFKNCSLFS